VFYQADPQRPWNYKWIGFGGVHAESLVRTLCEDNTFPAFRITKPREASRLIELVIASLEKGKRAAATKAAGLALQFLALLQEQREQPVERRTSAAQLVGEARAFVDQNYQREIDVAAVVNHIGVDRAHFSRVFRQQVGHSLQEYLIATRMERAGRLLVETSLPVHAVASSVGYRNYASFARRFAEYFGCSPSDRRRSAQAVP
jgi:transcriptional regulator GlxA family with amidase domain